MKTKINIYNFNFDTCVIYKTTQTFKGISIDDIKARFYNSNVTVNSNNEVDIFLKNK